MKKTVSHINVILLLIAGAFSSNAQVMTNNGAAIFSNSGALIFVDGEMVNQASGTYDNNGTIELTGDWTNNAGNAAFINASPGEVLMSGAAQNIQGSDVTVYHDLTLAGTGIKTQQINAIVEDTLDLTNQELATDTFVMYITNTSLTSIIRTTGFVSSLDTGGLSRNMGASSVYTFQVGSGTIGYRPLEITPADGTPHTYKVRMADVDATTEGYNRGINDSAFCIINPTYYHRIYQTNGASAADIRIYFDNALDNTYQSIAHWQNVPRWEDIAPITLVNNTSPTLSHITKLAWADFALPSYALGTTSPSVTLSSNDTSICAGDTLTFTASAGYSNYEFFNNSVSVQSGGSNTYVVSGLTTGDTIVVSATDTACSAVSNSIVVTVNPLPVLDTNSLAITQENCGASDGSIIGITATGNAPLTYQWVNGSSTVVGGDSANVMNIPADTYTLTVTSGDGCASSTNPVVVPGTIGPSLDISGISITQSTCGSSDGAITGITSSGGTSPFTFDWVNGSSTSVGGAIDLNSVPADTYTLTITDSNGCTDVTGPHIITDPGSPVIDTSAMVIAPTTCGNSDGSVSGVTASGGAGTLTYDWVDGSSTSVGGTSDITGLAADSYTLTVTDSMGCTAVSGPHIVPDLPGPSLDISGITITQSSCASSDGSITGITVSGGTNPLTFEWLDGSSTTVGTALDLNAVPTDNYFLTVTDSNGCADSTGPHSVTDAGAPTIDISAMVIDSSRCDSATGSITGIVVTGGTSPITYVWDDPSTQNTIDADSLFPGSFILTITDSAGCIAFSGPHNVPSYTVPSSPASVSPLNYCQGDVIAPLTATGSGGTITWYNDTGLTNVVNTGGTFNSGTISDTSFWVTESSNGCESPATQVDIIINAIPSAPVVGTDATYCTGDTFADLIAIGSNIEWWSDQGLTLSLGTGDTLSIAPGVGTTVYYATQTVNSCISSADSVVITVDLSPVASISGTSTICEGNSTTLVASGGTTYLWDTSPTQTTAAITVSPTVTTVYIVTVTSGSCSDADTVTVTVNSLPVAQITAANTILCEGSSTLLTADTASNYLWTPNGEITQSIVVTPAITTTYGLTTTNACGSDIDFVVITVNVMPEAGPNTELCKNLDPIGFIDGFATPPGGTWSSNDPLVSPSLTSAGFVDHISIPWGNGYVIYYTVGGCTDSLLLDVTGAQTGPDTIICPGSGTFFLTQAQPANGTWSYVDPQTGIITTGNIINVSTGEIEKEGIEGPIKFIYTSQGCPDTMLVTLCGDNDIFVPNIFSPTSGNVNNNTLKVFGDAIDFVNISIYDRWGELVYRSASTDEAMNDGWDGKRKGRAMTPQVFVYYLDGAFMDGEEFFMQGNITLVK